MPTERALKSPSAIARLQQVIPGATATGSSRLLRLFQNQPLRRGDCVVLLFVCSIGSTEGPGEEGCRSVGMAAAATAGDDTRLAHAIGDRKYTACQFWCDLLL